MCFRPNFCAPAVTQLSHSKMLAFAELAFRPLGETANGRVAMVGDLWCGLLGQSSTLRIFSCDNCAPAGAEASIEARRASRCLRVMWGVPIVWGMCLFWFSLPWKSLPPVFRRPRSRESHLK